MRTRAKPNADKMVARQINNEDPLDFRTDETDVGEVNEVDD